MRNYKFRIAGDALKAAKGILNDVSKQYNDISNTLKSAEKAAKKFNMSQVHYAFEARADFRLSFLFFAILFCGFFLQKTTNFKKTLENVKNLSKKLEIDISFWKTMCYNVKK